MHLDFGPPRGPPLQPLFFFKDYTPLGLKKFGRGCKTSGSKYIFWESWFFFRGDQLDTKLLKCSSKIVNFLHSKVYHNKKLGRYFPKISFVPSNVLLLLNYGQLTLLIKLTFQTKWNKTRRMAIFWFKVKINWGQRVKKTNSWTKKIIIF